MLLGAVLLAAVVVVPWLLVLDIAGGEAWLFTVAEVVESALATAVVILFLWLFWRHGRASVRDRPVPRRGHIVVAEGEPVAAVASEPVAAVASEPVAVAVAADDGPRGLDWANGAARLGIALAPPVIGTVVSLLHPDSTGSWAGPLWVFFPLIGLWFVWEAWLGILRDDQLTSDPERRILSGRTQWPISRPRSVRLDQLVRVRFLTVFNGRSFSDYLLFVDRFGGRAMVEDSTEIQQAARWGLTSSMPVVVGEPTRRALSGQSLPALRLVVAVVSVALAMAIGAFGVLVLGPIGAELQG